MFAIGALLGGLWLLEGSLSTEMRKFLLNYVYIIYFINMKIYFSIYVKTSLYTRVNLHASYVF